MSAVFLLRFAVELAKRAPLLSTARAQHQIDLLDTVIVAD
jgi:hypothetical protein